MRGDTSPFWKVTAMKKKVLSVLLIAALLLGAGLQIGAADSPAEEGLLEASGEPVSFTVTQPDDAAAEAPASDKPTDGDALPPIPEADAADEQSASDEETPVPDDTAAANDAVGTDAADLESGTEADDDVEASEPGDIAAQRLESEPLRAAAAATWSVNVTISGSGKVEWAGQGNGVFTSASGSQTIYGNSGEQITLLAIPADGCTFKRWEWPEGQGVGTFTDTNPLVLTETGSYYGFDLTAVFEAATGTKIENVTVNATPPTAGTSAADAKESFLSVPSGAHYSAVAFSFHETQPEIDGMIGPDTAEFTGAFEAGKTYYAYLYVTPESGYELVQGGGGYTNTTFTANGASSVYGDDLYITNMMISPGELMQWGNAVVSFTPEAASYNTGYKDIYIDNTEDASVSYVTGSVHLTGSGGTQAGYDPEKEVYSNNAAVTYSNPKTSQVQGMINDAYTQAYNAANTVKNNGSGGDFDMSAPSEGRTGGVWDHRLYVTTYTVTDGPGITTPVEVEYVSGASYKDSNGKTYSTAEYEITRTHEASGDYGKETFYEIKADGTVSGWDITVTNDGGGTASADLTASLAGETVTLTATPKDGYEFDKWEVISGGAELADATAATTAFAMPKADVEVKAVFQATHTHTLTKTDKVEPTCTEAGTEEYWTCSECGKLFSDAEGSSEISAPKAIPALGHDYVWTQTKTPTCTEPGEETGVCSHDASHTATREIAALGHDWGEGEVTKEPTCTEPGVKTFTCTRDAAHTKTEPVDPLGHDWGDWETTAEPTETEDGSETRTCKVDPSHTETRVIPALTVEYRDASGDGSSWTKGSGDSLAFTFKRNRADETTLSHFTGILIDGKAVDASNYTADSGSVIVTLKPACLETLSVGKHKLTALFDDGNDVAVSFTVKEKAAAAQTTTTGTGGTAKTGDDNRPGLWRTLTLLSGIALAALMGAGQKRRYTGRHCA